MTPARIQSAVLSLVSGRPRVGSLPRGPNRSDSRAPRRRRHSDRADLWSCGFEVCKGPAPLGPTARATPRLASARVSGGHVETRGVAFLEDLGRLALFVDLPREELEQIAASAEEVSFGEGEWIIRQGDPQSALRDRRGRGRVMIDDESRRVLPKGSFFGEVAVLLDEPATASMITRSPVTCLVIPGPTCRSSSSPTRWSLPDPEGRGAQVEDRLRVANVMQRQANPIAAPARRSPATCRSPSTGSSATCTRRRSSAPTARSTGTAARTSTRRASSARSSTASAAATTGSRRRARAGRPSSSTSPTRTS